MDQPVVGAGGVVHLPVAVPGALLYVGDVHACQGDGELSGVGLEIAATVRLRVDLATGAAPSWPWVAFDDRLAVLVADEDFTVARREACEAMVTRPRASFGLEPAEAMALISVAGDMRMGQTMGRGADDPAARGPTLARADAGVIVDVHSHLMWYPDHIGERFAREALASKLVKLRMSGGAALRRIARPPLLRLDARAATGRPRPRPTASSSSASRLGRPVSGCPTSWSPSYVAQHPDKLIGWASVDPGEPDAIEQLEHAVLGLGLRGVKLGPAYQHFDPTDRRHWPFFAGLRAPRASRRSGTRARPSRARRGCASACRSPSRTWRWSSPTFG